MTTSSAPMRALVERAVGGGWGLDAAEAGTEQVAVIRGADFPDVAHGDTSRVPVRWESARKIPQRKLQVGDIILEISGGTSERPTGRTVFVSERLLDSFSHDVIPASFCRLVRIDEELADPHYVYWWLQGMYAEGRTWSYQNRSTGIANFQFEHFLDTEKVRLPDRLIQREIAATLGALEDKIASNWRAQSLIEALVRSKFDQLFDVSQDPTGVPISDLVHVNPRRSLPRGTNATYVGMSSLPEFSAEIYEWEKRVYGSGQKFINGDVLMARITPCLENGKTALADMLEPDEVGWGSTEYIVLGPRGFIATAWIYCLVRHESVREFAIRGMTGTSGRQRFAAGNLDDYRISPPSESALAEFNEVSQPLFDRMKQLRDENLALASTRDAILPDLLSGNILPGSIDGIRT